jgi:hypothetical protein
VRLEEVLEELFASGNGLLEGEEGADIVLE